MIWVNKKLEHTLFVLFVPSQTSGIDKRSEMLLDMIQSETQNFRAQIVLAVVGCRVVGPLILPLLSHYISIMLLKALDTCLHHHPAGLAPSMISQQRHLFLGYLCCSVGLYFEGTISTFPLLTTLYLTFPFSRH